jgi:hypothetical protein
MFVQEQLTALMVPRASFIASLSVAGVVERATEKQAMELGSMVVC